MTIMLGEITYTQEQLQSIEAMARMMKNSLKSMKLGPVRRRASRKSRAQIIETIPPQAVLRQMMADAR